MVAQFSTGILAHFSISIYTNHAFNSYFHTIGYYRFILCRFHPLADKVHVAVHKVYNAVVVFGVLVA